MRSIGDSFLWGEPTGEQTDRGLCIPVEPGEGGSEAERMPADIIELLVSPLYVVTSGIRMLQMFKNILRRLFGFVIRRLNFSCNQIFI